MATKSVMTRLLFILTLGCALISPANAQPVPPKNDFKMVVQPNGQHIALNILGDEHFSWLETRKGLVVVHNKQNNSYDYAVIKEVDGKSVLQSSGIAATPNDDGIQGKDFVPLKRQDVLAVRKQRIKQQDN